MATEKDHIALANGNHGALLRLLESKESHPEWVTTIAFYKAVQVTEAVIRNQFSRSSTSSHSQRLDILKRGRFAKAPTLYKHLRALWNLSMIARYLSDVDGKQYNCFIDVLPAAEVVKEVIKNRLVSLEQTSLGFLSEQGKKALITTNPADFS